MVFKIFMKSRLVISCIVLFYLWIVMPVHGREGYTIIMMVGDVKIIAGGAARAAAVNDVLGGGETIVTGDNSMADVSIGEKGLMRIQEKSRITLASLKKLSDDPDLDMNRGAVMIVMSKLKKGNSYGIKTPTQAASVRGTVFQLSGDENRSQLDVLTGTVMVNPAVDGMIQHQIEESVSENQTLMLDRELVRDVLARKKKLTLAALRSEIKESLMKQVGQIRETPGFRKLNDDLKKEIHELVLQAKQDLKEKKLDRKSLKEKMKEEKEKLREDMKQREKR